MKYSELTKKTIGDLKEQANEIREDLFQLRLKHKTQQLEDKSKITQARRDIARVMTKINEVQSNKEQKQ